MWHRPILNEVARKFGLPELEGTMNPTRYLAYAVDLMLIKAGQGDANDLRKAYNFPLPHPYAAGMGRGT